MCFRGIICILFGAVPVPTSTNTSMSAHRTSSLRTPYSVLVTGHCFWIAEMRYVSTSGAYHNA